MVSDGEKWLVIANTTYSYHFLPAEAFIFWRVDFITKELQKERYWLSEGTSGDKIGNQIWKDNIFSNIHSFLPASAS